jgi:hypothetical protein
MQWITVMLSTASGTGYNGQKEKAQKYTQWSIKHYRTKEWTLRTPLNTRDLL